MSIRAHPTHLLNKLPTLLGKRISRAQFENSVFGRCNDTALVRDHYAVRT